MVDEIKKEEEKKCADCTPPVEPIVTELSIEERLEKLEKSIESLIKPIEKAPEKPPMEPVPPAPEAPPAPPEDKKPEEQWPAEESMAVFMLDYIIKHPKSTAQDIAKAWIKSKQPKEEVAAKPQDLPDIPKEEPCKMEPLAFADKKSVEDISKKVDGLVEKFSNTEELKLSVKARDDKISELEKKLESTIPKVEAKIEQPKEVQSKTIQVPQEPKMEIENPITVKDGIITSSEFM